MNTLLANGRCDLAASSINVVFISHSAFEPRIKNMNPISSEENSGGEFFDQPAPIQERPGLTATLKTARFPDWSKITRQTTLCHQPDGLRSTRESDIFDASLRALNHRRPVDNVPPSLKLVEFSVELPDAKIVQLAADFTDWEEAPLDMMRFDGGVWATTVPLPAGIYAYRFLADGEWYDDPRAARRDPNLPGAAKTFVQVK
jgi:hypothetical protein